MQISLVNQFLKKQSKGCNESNDSLKKGHVTGETYKTTSKLKHNCQLHDYAGKGKREPKRKGHVTQQREPYKRNSNLQFAKQCQKQKKITDNSVTTTANSEKTSRIHYFKLLFWKDQPPHTHQNDQKKPENNYRSNKSKTVVLGQVNVSNTHIHLDGFSNATYHLVQKSSLKRLKWSQTTRKQHKCISHRHHHSHCT